MLINSRVLVLLLVLRLVLRLRITIMLEGVFSSDIQFTVTIILPKY